MVSCSLEARLHVPGGPVTKKANGYNAVDRRIYLDMSADIYTYIHTCFLVHALKAPLMILAPCIRYGAGCLFALCKPVAEAMQVL